MLGFLGGRRGRGPRGSAAVRRSGALTAGWLGSLARPLEAAGEVIEGRFMGVQAPLERSRFAVLPVPYERTTTYKKGTARGPEAFLEGSLGVELWDEELGLQTWKRGIHTFEAFGGDEPPARFLPRLEARVGQLARLPGLTLFTVGGEHSLSQATIPAFARAHAGLSVLHFDAHADMRPDYEGDPYSHACALYPASRLVPVVQVGIRSVGEEEAHLLRAPDGAAGPRRGLEHGKAGGRVTTFLRHEHRDTGPLIEKVLDALTGTVYVSIDLDGFDPSVIPGVGTPQPGGFGWEEGLELFRAVFLAKRVVGVDIMELCPLQDSVCSELAAAKLAYRLMGYAACREGAPAGARPSLEALRPGNGARPFRGSR